METHRPTNAWQALFKQGEKVRLRFINSSAMTILMCNSRFENDCGSGVMGKMFSLFIDR